MAVGDRVFGVSDDGAGSAELALLTFRAPIPPSLGFVDAAGREEARAGLAFAVELTLLDRNISDAEKARMRALAEVDGR